MRYESYSMIVWALTFASACLWLASLSLYFEFFHRLRFKNPSTPGFGLVKIFEHTAMKLFNAIPF